MLKYVEICWDMLKYVGICWIMLKYVEICWNMLSTYCMCIYIYMYYDYINDYTYEYWYCISNLSFIDASLSGAVPGLGWRKRCSRHPLQQHGPLCAKPRQRQSPRCCPVSADLLARTERSRSTSRTNLPSLHMFALGCNTGSYQSLICYESKLFMNYPEISPNPRKSFQCQSRSTTNIMKLQKKLCDMTFFHGHRLLKNGKQNKPIPAPMGARSSVNAFCAGVSPDCPESAILECAGMSSRYFLITSNHI